MPIRNQRKNYHGHKVLKKEEIQKVNFELFSLRTVEITINFLYV